jgi:hypothetical protein
MSGIQFVTDEKGRKVAVQIDLKKHGLPSKTFGMALSPNRAARRKAFRLKRLKPTS